METIEAVVFFYQWHWIFNAPLSRTFLDSFKELKWRGEHSCYAKGSLEFSFIFLGLEIGTGGSALDRHNPDQQEKSREPSEPNLDDDKSLPPRYCASDGKVFHDRLWGFCPVLASLLPFPHLPSSNSTQPPSTDLEEFATEQDDDLWGLLKRRPTSHRWRGGTRDALAAANQRLPRLPTDIPRQRRLINDEQQSLCQGRDLSVSRKKKTLRLIISTSGASCLPSVVNDFSLDFIFRSWRSMWVDACYCVCRSGEAYVYLCLCVVWYTTTLKNVCVSV